MKELFITTAASLKVTPIPVNFNGANKKLNFDKHLFLQNTSSVDAYI